MEPAGLDVQHAAPAAAGRWLPVFAFPIEGPPREHPAWLAEASCEAAESPVGPSQTDTCAGGATVARDDGTTLGDGRWFGCH